jgi:uncharacterized protein
MNVFFLNVFYFIKKHKFISILVFTLIPVFCIFAVINIKFEEDISKIIPKGEKNDITAKVIQQINFADKIVVMIHSNSVNHEEILVEAAKEFVDTLSSYPKLCNQIQGTVSQDQVEEIFNLVYNKLPLFLDNKDLDSIALMLSEDSIYAKIQQNYNMLISPAGMVTKEYILKDPLGLTFLGLNKLKSLNVSDNFTIKNGFITSNDGHTIILFITPTYIGFDTKNNQELTTVFYDLQKHINTKFKNDVELTYFGAPFISVANANQIKSDIQNTVVVSLSILFLILIFFYRNIFIPFILFIPAVFGALISAVVIYFTNDSISAISISIGAVLLGITVDYPLHIITHYRKNKDVETLYRDITLPIISSGLTTSAAFLCLLFVNSDVLKDLGIFSSISVIVAAIVSLILIPHLYNPSTKKAIHFIDKLANYEVQKSKILVFICIGLVILGLFSYPKITFNNNLSDLNYVPDDMIKSEKQLENLGNLASKSIYLTAYGDNLETLLEKNTELEIELSQLKSQGIINDYTSIGKLVMSQKNQQEKINNWRLFWSDSIVDSTMNYISKAANEIGFKKNTFQDYKQYLEGDSAIFTPFIMESIGSISIKDFISEKDGFYTLTSIIKIEKDKREIVIDYFKDHSDVIVIDRKHLNEQFLGDLKNDFERLMNYSFIAIFLILLLFFRRIELALLSITPIVFTGLTTAGLMYVFGLEFNIFSTIVTTLILGLGIDFSIFMTNGLQQKYTTGKSELNLYRTSIIMSGLTTVLALGTLIFAKHPSLTSISFVSLIGIISAIVITFVLYPLLFKFCIERRPKNGKSPVSLRLFLSSLLCYAYYSIGGILYSLFGLIFMYLVPIKKATKLKWYRKIISKFIKSVTYTNFGLHNRILNPHNETFDNPAIIIANHSSFFDSLSMGHLNTPIIFLVNDWVYNSPIFGKAVQLAGYYPVSKGLENGEQELVNLVKNGYSIVIFPEGTRTTNRSIGRFHKGAFLLAQKYNIDIVPVYLHGNVDLIPKGDYIIYDGLHTLSIGERITFNQQNKDTSISEITKLISKSFKENFNKIRNEIEDKDYFKRKIMLSFLYKSADVLKKAKLEFENNKQLYFDLNPLIESDAKILRISNDLGIWDVMLALQQPKRKIKSYIIDFEHRNIANQSYFIHNCQIEYIDSINYNVDFLIVNTIFVNDELMIHIKKEHFKTIIFDQEFPMLNQTKYMKVTQNKNFVIYKLN